MSYVNHHFIRKLLDETERIALKQLDVEVCLSVDATRPSVMSNGVL
ncbi:MAG: hypothetical protein AAF632_24325 [Bacteroidota bacterium]